MSAHNAVDDVFLDLLQESVFTRDADGRIASWNRASEIIYGWSRHEAIGRSVHELLPSSHAVPIETLEREALQRGTWAGTLTRSTKAGDQRLIEVQWSARADQGSGGFWRPAAT